MKKQVIIIVLLIYSANLFAQEKYDQGGALLPQHNNAQKINEQPGNQNEVSESIFEANGKLKPGQKLPERPAEFNKNETPAVQYNADGSVGKVNQEIPKVNQAKKANREPEVYVRKTNQNIPVDYSNGAKEDYKRKSNVNIPVDYSNGAKEDYKRSQANQPIHQTGINHSPAVSRQTIAEGDKHLSDIELNKKYPQRNTNPNAIKPAMGSNSQVSDIETQKQISAAPKNTIHQSAPVQDKNKLSDRDVQNMKRK